MYEETVNDSASAYQLFILFFLSMKSEQSKPPYYELLATVLPAVLQAVMRLASDLSPSNIMTLRLAVKLYFQCNWVIGRGKGEDLLNMSRDAPGSQSA